MQEKNELQARLTNAKRKIKILSAVVLTMTMCAIAFIYLWQQAANKFKISKNNDYTDPVNKTKADQLVKDFRNATYYPDLDYKEGIKHDIKKLIEFFTYWHQHLNVDEVDFRFGLQDTGAKFPDMINIFIYPQSKKMDIPADPADNRTWPIDLGDLHP